MQPTPPSRAITLMWPRAESLRLSRRLAWWLLAWCMLFTGLWRGDALAQIQASGVLRTAMVNSPTSYFIGPAGETGFDYDLAREFAAFLGAELHIIAMDSPGSAMAAVLRREVPLAATPGTVTPARTDELRFSAPLRHRTPQLVGRTGASSRRSGDAISNGIIVPGDSAFADLLRELVESGEDLRWFARDGVETEQLLQQVAQGDIAHTVAGSDLVAITRRYYPELRVVRDLGAPQPIAWAVARNNGDRLHAALVEFLDQLGSTELERLRDRYFGHVDRLGYVDAVTLARDYESRLPAYREVFRQAGESHGIDWRLLAAVGYQESHWNNDAVSPTGVRGLMQITLQTAEFLGISNRMDPEQSIDAAARYLKSLHGRLPDSIPEPDRSWFMLASYNIGLGHVLDARRLTQAHGGDPNRWVDVRRHLPLLTQPRHYRQTRYGYARGPEAVHFVGNVRTYFDILVWLTTQEESALPVRPESDAQMRPPRGRDPLAIDQPLL